MVIRIICYSRGRDGGERRAAARRAKCRIPRTLEWERIHLLPNTCFLSTYYVTPTAISFKVKIMNKAEALGEVGGNN